MTGHGQSELRGAVIGAGYFSHFHYDAWLRIPGVKIVACCDIDAEKAQAAAAEYQIEQTFTNVETMLEQCDIDFADVITRPDTHLPICQLAASHGVAVICQKPLAPSTEEAYELAKAVAGVPFMVHENFRFQPWYREIKKLLEAGVIGDTLHTLSFRNRAGDGHGPDAYLARQPYFRTMPRFLLFEAGIHTVDTFRYLAGEISQVWCTTRKLNPVIAGEDAAMAVFHFESGAQGLYDANRFNESTAENPRYTFGDILVEANGGSIRVDSEGQISVQALGAKPTIHEYTPSQHGFAGDCVFATQLHFVSCLNRGTPFETNATDYLKSIAVQDAMYRSAETGCWEIPRS